MGERRINSAEAKAQIAAIDHWFLDHEEAIAFIMHDYRAMWCDATDDGLSDFLDGRKRTLSEMPLCWSLEWVVQAFPIPGFVYVSPKRGWITVGENLVGNGMSWGTYHGFLLNKKAGVVACTTFGQFVRPFDTVAKGDRIAMVEEMAPDLIVRGGSELALLRGCVDQICNVIGLEYIKKRKNKSEWARLDSNQ